MTQGDLIKNYRAVVLAIRNLLSSHSNPIRKGLTGTSSPENRLQIGASSQKKRTSFGFISIFFVVWAVRQTKGKKLEDMQS